jgi:ethanolamine-phosphate cytidylyltransferase
MDGAFDVMHYGHMNAFRLGRSLGTYLIVGVNSDDSITQCKGPPLMNDNERLAMVEGCKFVDEVVPNCPCELRVYCLVRFVT